VARSITEELTYPGTTVAEVSAMLGDPAFRDAVSTYQRALRSSTQVTPQGEGRQVVWEYAHGTEKVPGFAKKLVGDEIPIVQKETWTSESHADVVVTIPGKPGDMSGTADLRQVGDDVVETARMTVKVSIPLVGGKAEDLIAGILGKAMRAENKVGRKWLAGEWQTD
jgi:hypothetical protein